MRKLKVEKNFISKSIKMPLIVSLIILTVLLICSFVSTENIEDEVLENNEISKPFFYQNSEYFNYSKDIVENDILVAIPTIVEEKEYEDDVDYSALIDECLKTPLSTSFSKVKDYERLQNSRIHDLYPEKASSLSTYWFTDYENWNVLFLSGTMDSYYLEKDYKNIVISNNLNLRIEPNTKSEVLEELGKNTVLTFLGSLLDDNGELWSKVSYGDKIGYVKECYVAYYEYPITTVYDYTEDDLYWLAVGITMEMGSSWMPEYIRNYTGCVILNRVESSRYADTIYDVLHQRGQYPWASKWHKEPNERSLKTAKDLLEGKRMLPSDILYQAEFEQGNFIYETYYDEKSNTTIYYCG